MGRICAAVSWSVRPSLHSSKGASSRYGLTPSGISMSGGFPTFTAPPNPADFTGTIPAQNLDFKQGRIQQFNVNMEQEIPGQIVLTAGYAGSRSSHLLELGNNINVGMIGKE